MQVHRNLMNREDTKFQQPVDGASPLKRSSRPVCHLVVGPDVYKNDVRGIIWSDVQIYISQNGGALRDQKFQVLETDGVIQYDAFCDDFGPMNALSIIQFIEMLDKAVRAAINKKAENCILYRAGAGPRAFTNAAFLLGAYMILKLDLSTSVVMKCFDGLEASLFEPFRDASFSKPDFGLSLTDCWQGLERGKEKGWFTRPLARSLSEWGRIDKEAYAHYDDPLNADLHEIVPSRLIAFRGPKDLDGRQFVNNCKNGVFVNRDFSPEYYADILIGLGVSDVVQLNEVSYNNQVFIANGMQHHDLHIEKSSTPSPQIISRFFKIMDEAQGTVAVHGRGGLGCTGTLVALYLMRSHGFSAKAAIAWTRIMRPGSVIGDHQHYLRDIENSVRRLVIASAPTSPNVSRAASDASCKAI